MLLRWLCSQLLLVTTAAVAAASAVTTAVTAASAVMTAAVTAAGAVMIAAAVTTAAVTAAGDVVWTCCESWSCCCSLASAVMLLQNSELCVSRLPPLLPQ